MEDTLRERMFVKFLEKYDVLILVLMEDTLRGRINSFMLQLFISLNPCFNGRYSQSLETWVKKEDTAVLILVLMEDTLRVTLNWEILEEGSVLILVLMEDTLRVEQRLVSLCLSSFDVCLPL